MIKATKKSQIQRQWHLVDAKDQILGRLATQIVPLLLGKNKPYFVKNLDCGDHVVVINAKDIKVTGKKEEQKFYYSYSGYPGGLKKLSFSQLRERAPEKIIINAVSKMLPKNKLRDKWLAKLHVYADANHPYQDKFKVSEKSPKKGESNASQKED